MSNVNTVAVSGNVTRDPQVKWTSDDGESKIVEVGLAYNRRKKNKDDEYEDETSFFDVVVFGKFATLVDRKVRKGDAITVTGSLKQDRWTTDDGNRSKVVIEAREIDGACFYQKDDDVKGKEDGAAPAADAKPAPSDDDIPF